MSGGEGLACSTRGTLTHAQSPGHTLTHTRTRARALAH